MFQGAGALFLFNQQKDLSKFAAGHMSTVFSLCTQPMSGSQELRQDSHLQARQAQPETQHRRQWHRQRVSLFSPHEMHDSLMLWFLGISIAFPGKLITSMRKLLEAEASELKWPDPWERVLSDGVCGFTLTVILSFDSRRNHIQSLGLHL